MLLAQARMASLTARLSYRIEDAGTLAVLPPGRVRTQFARRPSRRRESAGGPSSGRSTGCIAC